MLFWIPVPMASGPSAADWMTAGGTLGTAVIAVAALLVTMWLAARDRRDGRTARDEERTRHGREIAEERERAARDRDDSERRLRQEREFAEELRRRDRREDSVAELIGRIAGLLPYLHALPGLNALPANVRAPDGSGSEIFFQDCAGAVRSLKDAGYGAAVGLGDVRAAEQYRRLVHLVLGAMARTGLSQGARLLMSCDLARYAMFVQASLECLTRTGASWDPGAPELPLLSRVSEGTEPWAPANEPPGWREAVAREPSFDPLYQAAE